MVSYTVSQIFYFYYILLIIRVFLSWIPSIDWQQQPFTFIRSITDPFLNIFRGIIPPIGGMFDISPILAFILLSILQGLVVGALNSIGL
jgi:YggT family protein